jgi:4-amino-4-deoxychorismate lyase
MYLLLETIQIRNGMLMNAGYHQQRMNSSSQALLGKRVEFNLTDLIIPAEATRGIVKCRILYKSTVEKIEFQPYIPKKINSLKLVFDNQISYSHKFADRSALNQLLKQRGTADDILIVKNGRITDTSFSNIVFRKGTEFFTPNTFLLNGTKRKQLLDDGLIKEMIFSEEVMSEMDSLILINSMLDLDSGVSVNISSINA